MKTAKIAHRVGGIALLGFFLTMCIGSFYWGVASAFALSQGWAILVVVSVCVRDITK